MNETGTTDIDRSGEESHSERFVVGDALKGTNEVCSFEVLQVWSAYALNI